MRVASSYLEDRMMVEIKDGTKEIEITAGDAQGSVAGPTIWNIHYDALLWLILRKDVVLVGYADDVAMVAVAATIEELEWKCNETLETVSQWMKEHGLKLAQKKSAAVLVTKRRKFDYPKLVLYGYTIQFQDSIWYLGLWIDRHWNFKDHIRRTSTKAGNVGTALQQLIPTVGGLKQGSLALLATVVNSVLLYGSPLWRDQPKTAAESWVKIACYFRHVITNKTEKETEIQRVTNHGSWD